MKKILSALVPMLMLLACSGQETAEYPEVFDLLAQVPTLSPQAGTVDVTISTDYTDFDVIMASSEPWVTLLRTKSLPVEERTLTFSYTENPGMTVRREVARVISGGVTLGEIVFTQKEAAPCIFEFEAVPQLSASEGSFDVLVKTDYPDFDVRVEGGWLSCVTTAGTSDGSECASNYTSLIASKSTRNAEDGEEAVHSAHGVTKGAADVNETTLHFVYEANRTKDVRHAKAVIVYQGSDVAQIDVSQEAYDGLVLERVYSKYAVGAEPWCSFIPGISNRSMTSDGRYIYLNSSEASAKIYAVDIASLLNGAQEPQYKALPVGGVAGGTHAVSVIKCVPNESGDPVLVASNLAIDGSQNLVIYAYTNGVDKDPEILHQYRWDGVAQASDWRRYGDRFSVCGTWQKGSLWFASQNGTKVMAFHINNGKTEASQREYCWFDGFGGGLAEATLYPATGEAMVTTSTLAQFWTKNADGQVHPGGSWPKWDAGRSHSGLVGAYSFQFFEFDGTKYIAYVQFTDNKHCDLVVVEDLGGFESSLSGEALYRIPLYEGSESSCAAANTYGDCSVVKINGKQHIVAMMQGGGLSIFEVK